MTNCTLGKYSPIEVKCHAVIQKCLALPFLALFGFSAHAGTFVYDGKFVFDQYDRVFSVSYDVGGNILTGGTLALATVGNATVGYKQYMYFDHPLGFKDLSYGKASDQRYRVGWGGDKHNDLKKAIHSEYFKFGLTTAVDADTNVTYNLKFNPDIPEESSKINDKKVVAGGPGTSPGTLTVGTGDSATTVSFRSTLDYNASLLNDGDFDGALGVFNDHSPQTIAGCDEDDSSSIACYMVDGTKDENVKVADWVFELGVEIELVRDDGERFFGDLANVDLSYFGYQDENKLINLLELHASPAKFGCESIQGTSHKARSGKSMRSKKGKKSGRGGGRSKGKGGKAKHSPCGATVNNLTDVPEPGTLWLFALALLGLGYTRRFSKGTINGKTA